MRLEIPEFSLVLLVGTTGSGKSTFARKHFLPTQILSSDAVRGFVMDDESDQRATPHAFEALHYMLEKRLQLGRLTVIDATNVQSASRRHLNALASKWHALKVAIVLDIPPETCAERNSARENRQFGPHVLRNQYGDLRRSFGSLKKEGFHKVYFLKPEDIDQVEIEFLRIWSRRYDEHGPFDIIGDVHGCLEELEALIGSLGYEDKDGWWHPEGRKLVFVGDLVDRGPESVEVVRKVMSAVKAGLAHAVPGNHDVKLARALKGGKVSLNHGLAETMEQFSKETEEFKTEVADFFVGLVSHAVFDSGKLCVAHAGMPAEMQGRGSAAVREFALYGETTGEIDEFGLPVRYPWASEYRGEALVVYGHTPVPEAEFYNNTIDIDTGCCFGGKLTAFRYPEREIVSVESKRMYSEPARPMDSARIKLPQDDVLDISDVINNLVVESRLGGRRKIRDENAAAALEIISRFSTDPRWMIYLPPTMSPCQTSRREGYLEYPTEALNYYKEGGVSHVVCEEKHMGSRAIAIICDSAETASKRFSVDTGESGAIMSRTGRRFFDDLDVEQTIVNRIARACESSGLFEVLRSRWVLLDLELMPWSAKAIGLLREQYAPVGVAATTQSIALQEALEGLQSRGAEDPEFAKFVQGKREAAEKFRSAYRRYCWSINSLEDYKFAPFHILASASGVHVDQSHIWHMQNLSQLCSADPAILHSTPHRIVDLSSESEVADVCAWWENLVQSGGEGMVVKPLDFIVRGTKGLLQPAIKCRGPEYLRIIYGPEYLEPNNLERLRHRSVNRKRMLANAEFALGIEALERFNRGEGLRRVHECVFAILAMESEPVDPRL